MRSVSGVGLVCAMVMICAVIPVGAGANAAAPVKASVGDAAPAFAGTDLEGNKVVLQDLLASGKSVLLNFWGLRCGACIEEIGYLNRLHDEFSARGVVFLGVNVDGVKADVVARMMAQLPNVPRYRVLADPDFAIPDLFAMEAAPLSIVIGRDGKILYRHDNFQAGDEKAIAQALEKAAGPRP